MKRLKKLIHLTIWFLIISFYSCNQTEKKEADMNIIFLHHSTGGVIWNGKSPNFFSKIAIKINPNLVRDKLPVLFNEYNKRQNKNYQIDEIFFPKSSPYGWNNYPYDYYNIWVKNAGEQFFMEEPTLEILTKDYHVIIFKHCFPVSNIQADLDSADINSNIKTLSNYKLQYSALRDKLHEFPNIKFILFTGAVQVESQITTEEAIRAKAFNQWVIEEWNLPNDNIYLWDLYGLQTEGDLFFKEEYAASINDSHPNGVFASNVVELLFNRIIDVIENNGEGTQLSGKKND